MIMISQSKKINEPRRKKYKKKKQENGVYGYEKRNNSNTRETISLKKGHNRKYISDEKQEKISLTFLNFQSQTPLFIFSHHYKFFLALRVSEIIIYIQMLANQQILYQWEQTFSKEAEELLKAIESKSITIGDRTMKFDYFLHGDSPEQGYSLIFGLHGGGGCTVEVNNQQHKNHLHLYDKFIPSGTIWFVPRSLEDAWDMWWHSYLPDFFSFVIKGFVLNKIVNPNKIFVTGYSAGGDGIYHLGPMIADWLAGAAMMAGHPNNSQLFNVRNISFSIQVGGEDQAYQRNDKARQYIQKMKDLRETYGGFKGCYNKIHQEYSHWMKLEDAAIFPDFFNEVRNPYPNLILFKQHPRTKKHHFYYISIDAESHKDLIQVRKVDNIFYIKSEPIPITVYVNHLFVDFKQQVIIYHNKKKTVCRLPVKKNEVIIKSIRQRHDPWFIFQDQFVSNPIKHNHLSVQPEKQ